MNPSYKEFTLAGTRLIVATALVATLGLASVPAFAADPAMHAERAELRIKDMHTRLKITPAQEAQWAKVAQVMSENAKSMDALTQARADNAKAMSAVDDLKSYAAIADAHAEELKKLTPVFAALYDGMTDAQKKEADTLFRHGGHRHGHMHGQMKAQG